MKKTLLFFLCLLSILSVRAQTCSAPISLTVNTGFTPLDSTNLSLTYYKFVATNTEHGIKFWVKNGNGPSAKLQLKCYKNNCGSLPASEIVSIVTTNYDTFYVDLPSVNIGVEYLIELRNYTPNYLVNRISISNNRRSSRTSNQLACPSTSLVCLSTNPCDFVCNGSFECQSVPTLSINGIFEENVYNWNCPTSGTADLFSTNSTFTSGVQSPCNMMGNQSPQNGTSYAGIIWGQVVIFPADSDKTEYIQTKLTNTLTSGAPYTCSMWVRAGEKNQYQFGNSQLGIFLTQGPLSIPTTSMITLTPNAVSTNTGVLNQNNQWSKITLTFTASGGEDHLTIGRPAGAPTIAISQTTNNCSTWTNTEFYSYLYIDNVSLVPTLTISANANFPVTCSGAPVNLTATSSIAGTTFTWMPGNLTGSSVNVNPTVSTTYTLLASGGCAITNTASTTLVVTVTPQVITTSPSTTICINTSATLTANASVSPASFTWMPGNLIGSSVAVSPTATTIYTVTGTAANGCSATKTVQVNVFTPPGTFTLNASSSLLCINQGQSTSTLTATGSAGLNYTWTPGPLFGAAQTVTPSATTIYTTTALSVGCIVTKTIAVAVQSACCTSTIPALTTTTLSGAVITGPQVINFDLTISGSTSSRFQNGEFLIAPNVKITVLGTTPEFLLIGAHLYACSTTMWKGIDILDGSRLVSVKSPTTGNSTLIEDAITAVNLDNVTTGSSTLPLEITNTIFNKNYVAINISNVTTNSLEILYNKNVITSRSLTFTPTSWPNTNTTGAGLRTANTTTTALAVPYLLQSAAIANLKNPYTNQPSRIGINLNNVGSTSGGNYYGVTVGTSTSTGGVSDFNIFDAQMFGVDATNSNFGSINNVYQNTQSILICTPRCRYEGGTAIRTTINSNLNARLNMTAVGTNSTSYSAGNRFWNCHRAVEATNLYRLDCNYATFRSTQTTTAATSALLERGAYGISNTTNRFEHNIRYNNFNNINNPLSMIVYAGTYTYGVNSLYGVLANNVLIDYNYFGAQLTNGTGLGSAFLNTAINLQSATTTGWNNIAGLGLRIGNNQFNRAWRGTFIDAFAYPTQVTTNTVSLLNDATILGTQYGIRSGNTPGINIANNKLNAINTTNTLVTLVYLNSSPASAVTCNTLSASYQGFEFNSNSIRTVWKGNDMSNHARGMVLSNNGIIDTQGSAGNPSDNRWWGSWIGANNGTYVDGTSDAANSKLWNQNAGVWIPPNWGGPFPSTTYSVLANTPTTTGTYVCGSIPPPAMMSQLSATTAPTLLTANANNASIEEQYIANNTTYRYLAANPTIKNNNTSYVNFYNAQANSSIAKFKQTEASLTNGQITQAQTINNSVNVSNAVEDNYKSYYTLYAKYKNGNFSSADSASLINLAKLCPGVDGAIVYQARALYNLIYKTIKVYNENCSTINNSVSRFATNSTETSNLIKNWTVDLYPNPSRGNFTLVSKLESEELNVTITDVAGKLIYSNKVNTSNFIVNLDLSTKAGIYLINIKNSTNESITKKLVIAD